MTRPVLLLLWFCLGILPAYADITFGVTSPAVRFSPGTWAGDSGRGGTVSRVSWNNGAWCLWRWSTTAANPQATLQITNPTQGSAVSYFLDGALTDSVPVPAQGGITLTGLTGPGLHTLIVYTRNSPQARRWGGGNAYTVTGLTLDDDAKPVAVLPTRPWVLIVGDSITEGIAAENGHDSSLSDYSFLLGQGLRSAGYDYAVSACGYSGWLRPGDADHDVPGFYAVHNGTYQESDSRWNKIDAHTSLLDSRGHLSAYGAIGQEPAAILINYATNECLSGSDQGEMQASVTGGLTALRRAAPAAWLLILVPPGLYETRIYRSGPEYIAALKAGVSAYQAVHPTDKRTVVLDLGPDIAHAWGSSAYGGGVHPNAAGHAYLAPLLLQAVLEHIKGG